MSNWCHNLIIISGPEENMESFYEDIQNGFSLNKTFTCSDNLDARMNAWGTKWDVNDTPSSEDHQRQYYEVKDKTTTRYVLEFDTAWTPPSNWARGVAIKYGLRVTVEFEEPGCNLYGEVSYGPNP